MQLYEKHLVGHVRRRVRQIARMRRVLRAGMRRWRNKPVNKQCPILRDELRAHVFRFVTPAPSHRVYAYNLDSLVRYLVTSASFIDPMCRHPYNEVEVWRIQKLRDRLLPDLHPHIDLVRLAFDEQYRRHHRFLQELGTHSTDRAQELVGDLTHVFGVPNFQLVLTRFLEYTVTMLKRHIQTFSLVNPEACIAFIDNTIHTWGAAPDCPAGLLLVVHTLRDEVVARQRLGWRLVVSDASENATVSGNVNNVDVGDWTDIGADDDDEDGDDDGVQVDGDGGSRGVMVSIHTNDQTLNAVV